MRKAQALTMSQTVKYPFTQAENKQPTQLIAGDVFQHKLDECFGHIPNMIVIADDIMVVAKQPYHKDNDQTLSTLFETARKCNVRLNYEKL